MKSCVRGCYLCRLAIVVCASLVALDVVAAEETLNDSACLKAIRWFQIGPESDRGKGATAYFVRYAEESDSVTVEIDAEHVPWVVDGIPHSETLLAAYIAGNLRSQLETGINRNDPYSGLLMTIGVYRQLQVENKELSIPAIEQLIESYKGDGLRTLLNATPAEPSTE